MVLGYAHKTVPGCPVGLLLVLLLGVLVPFASLLILYGFVRNCKGKSSGVDTL